MYTETVDHVVIQAELTPELAMDLIRDLAAKGTEASGLRIELRRYVDETHVYLSVNGGFGTILKGQAVSVVIPEEATV